MWEILALLIGVGVVAYKLEKEKEEEEPKEISPLDKTTQKDIEEILIYINRYEKKEFYSTKRYKIKADNKIKQFLHQTSGYSYENEIENKIERIEEFYENNEGVDKLKERNEAFINEKKESDLCKGILINIL